MAKDEVKEFNEFSKLYQKMQAQKAKKAREHHTTEIVDHNGDAKADNENDSVMDGLDEEIEELISICDESLDLNNEWAYELFSFDNNLDENYNDESTNSEINSSSLDKHLNRGLLEQHKFTDISRPNKRRKLIDYTPIVFGDLKTKKGTFRDSKTIKILLDSGGSSTIVKRESVKQLKVTKDANTTWATTAGNFTTNGTCVVDFKLPELDKHMLVHKRIHVTTNHMNYDMIIGRDLLTELGIDILFSTKSVQLQHVTIPMKDRHCTTEDSFFVQEPLRIEEEMERLRGILDCKYQPADLRQVTQSCQNLNRTSCTTY